MSYSLKQLSQWSSASVFGNSSLLVEKIVYDSRKTFMPDHTLFVALKSANNDGHHYIACLYEKGIHCFIVEEAAKVDYAQYPQAGFIVCKDSKRCLQQIASHIRKKYAVPFIGITGSNGKTIVKEWLAALLEAKFKIGRSPRSYNSQLGVPLSIWMLDDDIDMALIEAGISKPAEMASLASCMAPDVGVLTNIGQAHQENFDSLKQKLYEKLDLFETAQTIIYNGNDELIKATLINRFPDKKLVSFGSSLTDALQITASSIVNNLTQIDLKWHEKSFSVECPFTDAISIDNALLCILSALELGLDIDDVTQGISGLQPIAMRLEQKEAINNCLLIDDAYNADLSSLELALDFLNQMGSRRGLSKTLILSDIYQSGKTNAELFQEIKRLAKEKGINKLIGIGANLYAAMKGEGAYIDTEAFLKEANLNAFRDEAILLKGSRRFAFERISAALELQRHKTVMEIDLNALADNVQLFKSKLNKPTRLLAMVKAFSYGTGSFEIANLLQHQKVDYLGVAFADEGIDLRKAGITLPIIVMNPELSSFPLMLENELEPEIYSFEVLSSFISAAQRQGLNQVPVHIKVDTGMNRLGFNVSELNDLIERLKQTSQIKVASVFSHLAGSDEREHDDFTKQQIATFTHACNELSKGLGYGFLRHILNSAGIERFPKAQFDMVRLGIGMYGVVANNNQYLQQVTRLKSYVSQLKKIKKGATVGYGRKAKADRDMTIAIVPIGYADGYNRRLSNGIGQLVINGKHANIVGNICMDMCMADVTNISVNAGDEVEVFGKTITLQELADTMETIPYEILTSISRRVKRVYVME